MGNNHSQQQLSSHRHRFSRRAKEDSSYTASSSSSSSRHAHAASTGGQQSTESAVQAEEADSQGHKGSTESVPRPELPNADLGAAEAVSDIGPFRIVAAILSSINPHYLATPPLHSILSPIQVKTAHRHAYSASDGSLSSNFVLIYCWRAQLG